MEVASTFRDTASPPLATRRKNCTPVAGLKFRPELFQGRVFRENGNAIGIGKCRPLVFFSYPVGAMKGTDMRTRTALVNSKRDFHAFCANFTRIRAYGGERPACLSLALNLRGLKRHSKSMTRM